MAQFENREMQNRFDSSRPRAKEKAKHEPDEKEMPEEDMGEVVAEHGPAEHVEIHSHHGDGHVHKSKHHDAKSASDHVHKAFGEEPPMHGEPDGDEAMPMSSGMGIPGMR